jgi:hypothetical protein
MAVGVKENRTAWGGVLMFLALALLGTACGRQQAESQAAKIDPATQTEYESTAQRALGEGSQVMLSGDLAHDGHIQLLIVNRLPQTPGQSPAGTAISRAAVLQSSAGDWHEIFLADDHLKNEGGFLQGTPRESVSAWRLRCKQGKDGLEMLFTPLQQPSGSDSATVDVRWNPAQRRYQSFDRKSSRFLAEVSSLEATPSYLIKR